MGKDIAVNELVDELALYLAEIEGGSSAAECLRRRPAHAADLEPLVLAAERLRQAPAVQPQPAFRQAARNRMLNLVAARPRQPAHGATGWLAALWGRAGLARLAAAGAVCLALLFTVGSAAANALPDSPLYSLRLAGEEAGLLFAGQDADRALALARLAEQRENELLIMAQRGSPAVTATEERYAETLRLALRLAAANGDSQLSENLLRNLERQQLRLQTALDARNGEPGDSALALALAETQCLRSQLVLRDRQQSQEQERLQDQVGEQSPVQEQQRSQEQQSLQQEQLQERNQAGYGPVGPSSPTPVGPPLFAPTPQATPFSPGPFGPVASPVQQAGPPTAEAGPGPGQPGLGPGPMATATAGPTPVATATAEPMPEATAAPGQTGTGDGGPGWSPSPPGPPPPSGGSGGPGGKR